MAISADKAADMRAKHLELLQVVIARMANYGATLKNYCITLTTAVCGFAATLGKPWAGLLALLPILICAGVDARYLCNERRFRGLYDKVRQEDWSERPSFDISLSSAPSESYVSCLLRWLYRSRGGSCSHRRSRSNRWRQRSMRLERDFGHRGGFSSVSTCRMTAGEHRLS